MWSIPKKVLGASLILIGIAGLSGCASKDADILSLKRWIAVQQERIDVLKLTKADMQRVIDLKNADLERQKKACIQAERDRGMRHVNGVLLPPQARAGECYARVLSPPVYQSETKHMSKQDAREPLEIVPAQYEWVEAQVIVKNPSEKVGTMTKRAQVGDGDMMWQPVLCRSRETPETIRQIQRALQQAYYYHGALDGIYGPQTRRAVASYQRAKGLAVGGLTFETLHSLGLKMSDKQVVAGAK